MVYENTIQIHRALMQFGKEYHDFVMSAVKLTQVETIPPGLGYLGIRSRIMCDTLFDNQKNPKSIVLRFLKAGYRPANIEGALEGLEKIFDLCIDDSDAIERFIFDEMISEVFNQVARPILVSPENIDGQYDIEDPEQYDSHKHIHCVLKSGATRSNSDLEALIKSLHSQTVNFDQLSSDSCLKFAEDSLALYRDFGPECLHDVIEKLPPGPLKGVWSAILSSADLAGFKDALFQKAVIEQTFGSVSEDHFAAMMVSVSLAYNISRNCLSEDQVKAYSILLKNFGF